MKIKNENNAQTMDKTFRNDRMLNPHFKHTIRKYFLSHSFECDCTTRRRIKKNSTQSTQYSSPIWIDWVGRRRDTNDGILFPICLSFGNYKFVPFTIKATSILVWLLVMSHRAATVYKNMLIYEQHSVMPVPRFPIQFFAWYQLVFGI